MKFKRTDRTGGPVVAMLGSLPPLRALSSYCLEFSRAMADLARVRFLSFRSIYPGFLYPGGKLKDDHTFPDVSHPQLSIRRILTWYNPLTWIIEGLFTRADLLHAQWWSLPLFPVYACICLGFRLRKKPVVLTVHNVLPHESSRLFTIASGLLFRLGSHFLVHSTENKRQLIRQYGMAAGSITVIPHGPLDFHAATPYDRDEARRKLNIPAQEKMILIFGAVRPYKGIHTAINAFSRIQKTLPDTRLVIAGKLWEDWTPYENQIKALKLENRIDTYLDYIPAETVSLFFMAADLVLLPYHHFDSQSGVGAIAVSFRKPMIVSNAGGLPDLVGNPANVVPPNNEAALAHAVIRSFSEPDRLDIMETEISTVADSIAWPAIAKTVLSVYKNLLSDSGGKTKPNN